MNKKIEIYARSIFLQGILLKNSKSLPRYFNRWRKKFNDFENWCDKNKILKVNACINTILKDKLFNKIIISVSNMSQLNQILDSFKNKRLKKIPNRFQTCDKKLIDPRLWKIN